MGLLEKTRAFQRHAFGSPWHKNVCKLSFGYTHTYKIVAAASDTAVHAAITSAFSAQTITSGITDPDVPRVLKVQPGGTASNIGNGVITITGTNVEGATITDTFQLVDGNTTEIDGTKAFKTVTSIAIPACEGTAATFSVGYTNKLGLFHRLFALNTTVKVFSQTTVGGTVTAQTAPTVNDWDETHIEKNFITPATTPNGTTFLTIYYIYDSWSTDDLNDNPVYLTSTSTSSTSTSTSTSTFTTSTSSTSTSSTSSSTSSTSSSTSSTSSSTSSTSTSTTTVP